MSENERSHASEAHYSGIVVSSRRDEFTECLNQLAACPGVEVHYSDCESGWIVVVLETDSLEAQEAGFRRVQQLPAVAVAALVEHRIAPREPTNGDMTR